jgi:hypothetical protein
VRLAQRRAQDRGEMATVNKTEILLKLDRFAELLPIRSTYPADTINFSLLRSIKLDIERLQ